MIRRTWWLALLAVGAACLTGCADRPAAPDVSVTGLGRQPNIVFVLTDDLSSNLVQYMPHVLAMEKAGTSFSNYTVSDSFCCPSRSSILTGNFPHDTGVFTNTGADGGFPLFHRRGEENHTFGTALQAVGYRTGFMGKYLNGYIPDQQFDAAGLAVPGNNNWVPPGWNTWDVAGDGYDEYHYLVNENHHIARFGHAPKDYLTDVLNKDAMKFVQRSRTDDRPFMLEVATFAPHRPATPAPQDLDKYPGLTAPHDAAWDKTPTDAPDWLAGKHFGRSALPLMNRVFRNRVLSVLSVDRMIGNLEQTLRATGQLRHTVFVFSSDNGFHIGEYGLYPGKLTAFDTDIQVPLVVTGPHIPAGRVDPSVVQNIDLAPTFEQIGGATVSPDVDGHSLVPLLLGKHVRWRGVALVEHHGGDFGTDNPDQQLAVSGDPWTYEAIRTPDYTYVSYKNGQREYYDHRTDPWELHNVYNTLSASRIAQLNAQVHAMADCHGGTSCWEASQAAPSD